MAQSKKQYNGIKNTSIHVPNNKKSKTSTHSFGKEEAKRGGSETSSSKKKKKTENKIVCIPTCTSTDHRPHTCSNWMVAGCSTLCLPGTYVCHHTTDSIVSAAGSKFANKTASRLRRHRTRPPKQYHARVLPNTTNHNRGNRRWLRRTSRQRPEPIDLYPGGNNRSLGVNASFLKNIDLLRGLSALNPTNTLTPSSCAYAPKKKRGSLFTISITMDRTCAGLIREVPHNIEVNLLLFTSIERQLGIQRQRGKQILLVTQRERDQYTDQNYGVLKRAPPPRPCYHHTITEQLPRHSTTATPTARPIHRLTDYHHCVWRVSTAIPLFSWGSSHSKKETTPGTTHTHT